MDARVNFVILPLAKQMMRPEQAKRVSGEGYLAAVVLHEICHGLGPAYSRVNGKQQDIRASIGPVYAALEESKADVVGMFGLHWLMDHGALPSKREEEYYSSYVAGVFRSVRYGIASGRLPLTLKQKKNRPTRNHPTRNRRCHPSSRHCLYPVSCRTRIGRPGIRRSACRPRRAARRNSY